MQVRDASARSEQGAVVGRPKMRDASATPEGVLEETCVSGRPEGTWMRRREAECSRGGGGQGDAATWMLAGRSF